MPPVTSKASVKARALVQDNEDLQKLVANIARHAPQTSETPKIGKHHSNIIDDAYPETSFSTVYTMEVSPEDRALAADMEMVHTRRNLPSHNDAHMHPWSYVQKGVNLDEMLLRMEMIRCKHSVLMPIPTSIISMQGDRVTKVWPPGDKDTMRHHCGPTYYIPDEHNRADLKMTPEILLELSSTISLHVDSEVDDYTADQFKLIKSEERDKLDPMITGLHLGSMYADITLFKKLLRHPGVFTGAGELTLNKEIVEHLYSGGFAAQASLHPRAGPLRDDTNILPTKQLMAALGVIGMPACIHCDVGDWQDPPEATPKNMEAFNSFLSDPRVIDTTIVWAHAGGLGRFVKQPNNHLENLGKMLDKNHNLALDISWNEVAKQLTGTGFDVAEAEKRTREWAAFLERYSERIMFGSDALAPRTNVTWTNTLITYEGLLSRLTPEARLNILEKSYEKYYVGARENVRRFENVVLPCIADKLTDPTVTSLNIAAIKAIRDRLYDELNPADLSSERSISTEEIEQSLSREKARDKFRKTLEKLISAREEIGNKEVVIVQLREEIARLQATIGGVTPPAEETLPGQIGVPQTTHRRVELSTQQAVGLHLGTAIRERIGQLRADSKVELTFLTPASRAENEQARFKGELELRDLEIDRLNNENTRLQMHIDNLSSPAGQTPPDQQAVVDIDTPVQSSTPKSIAPKSAPPQSTPPTRRLGARLRETIEQLRTNSHNERSFLT